MQHWEKWLIHHCVILPFRRVLMGWRNGQRNSIKFNKGKRWLLHLGRNSLRYQYRLGPTSWNTAEKALVILVDTKLYTSHHSTLANSLLRSIRKCIARRSREVILHLYSALMSHTWSPVSSFGLPVQERQGNTGAMCCAPVKGLKDDNGTEASVI